MRFYVAEVVETGFDFACALTGHAFGCWHSWGARWRLWALTELERQRAEGHAAWLARMTPEDRAEYEAERTGVLTTTPLPDTPVTVSASVSRWPTYTVRWNGAGGTFTR